MNPKASFAANYRVAVTYQGVHELQRRRERLRQGVGAYFQAVDTLRSVTGEIGIEIADSTMADLEATYARTQALIQYLDANINEAYTILCLRQFERDKDATNIPLDFMMANDYQDEAWRQIPTDRESQDRECWARHIQRQMPTVAPHVTDHKLQTRLGIATKPPRIERRISQPEQQAISDFFNRISL